MDTAKQRNIETFTRMAESYAGYYSDAEQARLGAMAERIGFGAGSWLVDFGMGTGTSARPFLVAGGNVVGLDLTPAMAKNGRERLREWGLDANARYVMANAHDAPVAEGTAAAVICRHTFHHLENPRQVFGEMARAVRPGGHVFLIDYHYPDEAEEREKIEELDRVREPTITRHLSQQEMEDLFREEGIRIEETVADRNDTPFDEWMNVAKTSPDVFPRLRAAFETLRDQGGSWYEEKGEGAEFTVVRKRLTILGRKPA